MPRRSIAIWCITLCAWPLAAFAQSPWGNGASSPVAPAGWHQPSPWVAPYADGWAGPAPNYPPAPIYEELVPQHTHYAGDPAHDLAFRDVISEAWVRVEYLNWRFSTPGNILLGAPMETLDPRERFPAVDRITGVRPNVEAFVPDTGHFELDQMNGIRGTIGFPSRVGTFELSAFTIQEGVQDLHIAPRFDPIDGVVIIPATTLLDQGLPSDTDMILFDTSYHARLESQMYGADAIFVAGPYEPNVPAELRPTMGLKFVQFYEDFYISGEDFASGTDHLILAKGHNNYVMTALGFRLESHHEFLTIGVEPRLLIGINRHDDSVYTEEIYDPAEAPNRTGEEATDFVAGFELQAYGKVHCTERFTLFAGYNLLFLSDVARPLNMIRYNDAGLANPPDIVYQKDREQLFSQGFTVGGELYFWD